MDNNNPLMKETQGSRGDEAEAPVNSEQMILFCQADGTRKHQSSVRLSALTHSVFHRGHSKEEKKTTVSALKCIGWNETQENCASFPLWSDAFLNAWSHCLKAIPIWSMANSVSKGFAGFDCYALTSSHSSKKPRAGDQRIEAQKRVRVSRYVHRYMRL